MRNPAERESVLLKDEREHFKLCYLLYTLDPAGHAQDESSLLQPFAARLQLLLLLSVHVFYAW